GCATPETARSPSCLLLFGRNATTTSLACRARWRWQAPRRRRYGTRQLLPYTCAVVRRAVRDLRLRQRRSDRCAAPFETRRSLLPVCSASSPRDLTDTAVEARLVWLRSRLATLSAPRAGQEY